MRTLFAFLKKEILETIRTNKITILLVLSLVFGIMNPAIAKLTPWLMKMFEESLAESGIIIGDIHVDALTSWQQFYKNIPMFLIAFVFIYSSTLTKEYESNTLILLLTKGFSRYKVIIAKLINTVAMWTISYFLIFIITYLYNQYYWDNSIAEGLLLSVLTYYIFGLLIISLIMLFSVLANNNVGVLLFLSLTVGISYVINFIPKFAKYNPISLMNSYNILIDKNQFEIITIFIALAVSVLSILFSIKLFNKKTI